jgi:hypothetical protein
VPDTTRPLRHTRSASRQRPGGRNRPPNRPEQLSLFPDYEPDDLVCLYVLISPYRTAFKLGSTNAPRRRGGEYKEGEMLLWWTGTRYDEQVLHDGLAIYRLPNNEEWYALNADTCRWLMKLCRAHNSQRGLWILDRIWRDNFSDEDTA